LTANPDEIVRTLTPAAAAPEPLSADAAARLTEFARACKAAARAVSLYPAAHPAIKTSLDRLVDAAARATNGSTLQLTVLPDGLLVDGHAAARPDPAIGELATLLHLHLVGAMQVSAGDSAAWRAFLAILARAPEDVRAEGGIGRVWSATGTRHLEITELDYAQVLRERSGGADATWDQIIANCLQGESVELSDETIKALLDIASDPSRLGELADLLSERSAQTGARGQVSALLRMFGGIIEAVSRRVPERLDRVLRNVASTVSRLTPDALLELISRKAESGSAASVDLVGEVVTRMTDGHVSSFVARSIVAERGASARLAEAFQALVPEQERKHRLLQLAHDELEPTPLGQQPDFPNLWQNAKDMLTSYSDESFVGREYARELSVARTQAVEVERVSDDPPDRIGAWLASVSDGSLRALDLQLLLDLMKVEQEPLRWRELTEPVVQHVEDLLLIGDFDAAARLVDALVVEAGRGDAAPTSAQAAAAVQRLVSGPLMRHIVSHLQTIDDAGFERAKYIVHTLGPVMIPPLAETLSAEDRARPRQRLTDLLIGFGPAGRQSVEQLRNSPNPAVRRTAIYLLREFGGREALPDLALLLDDSEPHVQREAIRAILGIGTDEAYSTLEKALASGTESSRLAIMEMLSSLRDDRAAPLFSYIVSHVDHRGPLRSVYAHAIESLGALRDENAVDLLREAIDRGEWYAPFRTAALRRSAALALHRIGTPRALDALRDAAANGSRGVRAAARAKLGRGGGPQ
jgi:HEAT repeat protein